jgi:hypothetical protein
MMTMDSARMLKRLEPAVRPRGAAGAAPPGAPRAPLESQRFDELLALVSTGSVNSGRAVQVKCAIDKPLDEQQMSRLAAAADLAEASGANRAVLLIDGRGLILDVPARALTQELTAASDALVVPLDAAVYVATGNEAGGGAAPSGPPLNTALIPPAIARQIEAARLAAGADSRSSDPSFTSTTTRPTTGARSVAAR